MIELQAVSKTYRKGRREVPALRGVSMVFKKRDFIAIRGASGSGKTTLLSIAGLLDVPSGGRIFIDGADTSSLSRRGRARMRASHLGFIFQRFNLIPGLAAWENVALSLYYNRVEKGARRRRALDALDRVGLTDRALHLPSELSGGEEQRVAIARSLVADPDHVLADEPTGNLDSANSQEIMRLLDGANESGTSIVVVSHDPQIVAHARKVLTLEDGLIFGGEQ